MQIVSNYFNNQSKYNTNFNAKGVHNPQKILTDKTMKVISSAIASAGIAGIALQQNTENYAQVFDKEITRSKLKNINPDVIAETMSIAPSLIDIIITDKNKNGQTRSLSEQNLKSLIDTYYFNSELTEQLLLTKNEKGEHKYTVPQINKLVEINDTMPELYETALENLSLVENMLEIKTKYGRPLYGINDIVLCNEASKINPKFTKELIKQKDSHDNTRFSGEQIKYIIENYDENDKMISFLLNAKIPAYNDEYIFKTEQIMELCQLAQDEDIKKIITKLSEPIPRKYGEATIWSPEDILRAAKNPNRRLTDILNNYHNYRFYYINMIYLYNLINGQLGVNEVLELLEIEARFNKPESPSSFKSSDIKTLQNYPELFTKEANELIAYKAKSY